MTCQDTITLFSIDNTLQGGLEAITTGADGRLVVLDVDPTGTQLWIVTSEKYIVLLELPTMDVRSICTINQTPTPSGIVVSKKLIYITSDVDQSLVYGYRLPN